MSTIRSRQGNADVLLARAQRTTQAQIAGLSLRSELSHCKNLNTDWELVGPRSRLRAGRLVSRSRANCSYPSLHSRLHPEVGATALGREHRVGLQAHPNMALQERHRERARLLPHKAAVNLRMAPDFSRPSDTRRTLHRPLQMRRWRTATRRRRWKGLEDAVRTASTRGWKVRERIRRPKLRPCPAAFQLLVKPQAENLSVLRRSKRRQLPTSARAQDPSGRCAKDLTVSTHS